MPWSITDAVRDIYIEVTRQRTYYVSLLKYFFGMALQMAYLFHLKFMLFNV